ncbi:hypothetical protein [Sphingomonas sp. PB4P5]|uniref:hypothetical protein n=1 Tax=Parasphingomonas puruogangriensis TaxID=3096155 RepID=UPI002FCC8C83
MREREPLFGSLLIISVAVTYLVAGLERFTDKPTWVSAFLALSYLLCAVFVCRSIYRDRVK